jgi:methylmalonyl-CoA/ethylmalonyl-CoA epimerase
MLKGIDHVAIAVRSLESAVPLWRDLLGFEYRGTELVESEGVRVALLVSGPFRIELMEPSRADSSVQKFLDQRGPGLHHLCLAVDGISQHLEALKDAGIRLINDTPKEGAEGCQVAFVHPKATGGVLLELSERPANGH